METNLHRDPACQEDAPDHRCQRRDGTPLNGDNGDCYTTARTAATGAR